MKNFTVNIDGINVDIMAYGIIDAFGRARKLYPKAVVVTDTLSSDLYY